MVKQNHLDQLPEDLITGAEPFSMGSGNHAILFLHGWTSTPRELRFLANSLKGIFYCRGPLLHGHGSHERDLENTTWEGHFKQVLRECEELTATHDKLSLVGFSYGGALAVQAAARRKIENLILISPFFQSPGNNKLGIPSSKLVPYLPRLFDTLKKDESGPIFDPLANQEHIRYALMPVKPLKSVVACGESALSLAEKIRSPLLILQSTQDRTSGYEGSIDFLNRASSMDKALVLFSRSNHILPLDYDRAELELQIHNWISNRK